MAIRASKKDLSSLELIGRKDDALAPDCDYGEYLKTLDQSKLKFRDGVQPTRFLLNFELTGKESERVKNAMISGKDEDGDPAMALGSWQFALARVALKGIQNPTDIPEEEHLKLELDDRGLPNEKILGKLDKYGVIQDIFSAYSALVLSTERGNAKN